MTAEVISTILIACILVAEVVNVFGTFELADQVQRLRAVQEALNGVLNTRISNAAAVSTGLVMSANAKPDRDTLFAEEKARRAERFIFHMPANLKAED